MNTGLFRVLTTVVTVFILLFHLILNERHVIDSSDVIMAFLAYPSIWVMLMMLEFESDKEEVEQKTPAADLLGNKNGGV